MSDFTPPPRKGPPGPPPRPASADPALDVLPQPNPFLASDPDKTPINPATAPQPIDPGLVTSVRELTPITTAFATAPQRPQSPPLPPMRSEQLTQPFGFAVAPAPDDLPTKPVGNPMVTPPQAMPEAMIALSQRGSSAPAVAPRAMPQVVPGGPRPGYEAPSFKDPHAAFRQGNKLKGLLFVALGGGILAALFFMMPDSAHDERKSASTASTRESAVIGSSVSPDIIADPRDAPADSPARKAAPSEPAPPSSSAPSTADNAGFANNFKSSAR